MVWAVIFALAVAAVVALVQPLFRAPTQDAPALDDEDYLAAQLEDIERERDAGLLSDAAAEAAVREARRRLLDRARAQTAKAKPVSPQARMASAMAVAAAPAAALAIYLAIGNPSLSPAVPERFQGAPAMQAAAPPATGLEGAANAPALETAIAQLAARLNDNPDDLDGWIMLAESYAATDRFAEAADAFARAIALAPERAALHAARGEAVAMAAGGRITDEARAEFDRALALDPAEPRARFYAAIAIYQAGDTDAALDGLVALANDAEPGALWLPIVGEQIAAFAEELGRSMDDLPFTDGARAHLSALPAGGASSTSPEILEAQIAVGGAPYTDWLALIDAYAGAGDAENAADALARARQRYAAAPFVLQELDAAAVRLGLEGGDAAAAAPPRGPSQEEMQAAASMSEEDRAQMIEGMVAGLAARLESQPDDLEGWIMLGRSYGVLGRRADSVAAFERAVALAPDNMPVRLAHAQALMARLDAEGRPIDGPALDALKAIEQRNPDEPLALFFLGLAAQQGDDAAAARDYWQKLLAQLPEGSDDAASVKAMIEGL